MPYNPATSCSASHRTSAARGPTASNGPAVDARQRLGLEGSLAPAHPQRVGDHRGLVADDDVDGASPANAPRSARALRRRARAVREHDERRRPRRGARQAASRPGSEIADAATAPRRPRGAHLDGLAQRDDDSQASPDAAPSAPSGTSRRSRARPAACPRVTPCADRDLPCSGGPALHGDAVDAPAARRSRSDGVAATITHSRALPRAGESPRRRRADLGVGAVHRHGSASVRGVIAFVVAVADRARFEAIAAPSHRAGARSRFGGHGAPSDGPPQPVLNAALDELADMPGPRGGRARARGRARCPTSTPPRSCAGRSPTPRSRSPARSAHGRCRGLGWWDGAGGGRAGTPRVPGGVRRPRAGRRRRRDRRDRHVPEPVGGAHAALRLALAADFHGYDVDLCFQARHHGKRVEVVELAVSHEHRPFFDDTGPLGAQRAALPAALARPPPDHRRPRHRRLSREAP